RTVDSIPSFGSATKTSGSFASATLATSAGTRANPRARLLRTDDLRARERAGAERDGGERPGSAREKLDALLDPRGAIFAAERAVAEHADEDIAAVLRAVIVGFAEEEPVRALEYDADVGSVASDGDGLASRRETFVRRNEHFALCVLHAGTTIGERRDRPGDRRRVGRRSPRDARICGGEHDRAREQPERTIDEPGGAVGRDDDAA